MYILVTYDINTTDDDGRYRLRQVSKICKNVGHRVQESVFECLIDASLFTNMVDELNSIIDPELDSIRFYNLGDNWKNRIQTLGRDEGYDPQGLLII